MRHSVIQCAIQSYTPPFNHTIRHSIIQSAIQSYTPPFNHTLRHSVIQSAIQSYNPPFNHTIRHSVMHSVFKCSCLYLIFPVLGLSHMILSMVAILGSLVCVTACIETMVAMSPTSNLGNRTLGILLTAVGGSLFAGGYLFYFPSLIYRLKNS